MVILAYWDISQNDFVCWCLEVWSFGLEARKACPAAGLRLCPGNICPSAGSWGVWETEQIVSVCACELLASGYVVLCTLLPPAIKRHTVPSCAMCPKVLLLFSSEYGFSAPTGAFLIVQRAAVKSTQSVHWAESTAAVVEIMFKLVKTAWLLRIPQAAAYCKGAAHPTDPILLHGCCAHPRFHPIALLLLTPQTPSYCMDASHPIDSILLHCCYSSHRLHPIVELKHLGTACYHGCACEKQLQATLRSGPQHRRLKSNPKSSLTQFNIM